MTDQEIFLANKESIEKKYKVENNRRAKLLRMPEFTPEEVNIVVGEMVSHIKSGGRLSDFKIEEYSEEQQPLKSDSPLPPVKNNSKDNQKTVFNGEILNFEIVICSNGFVLNKSKNGEKKPYIFKTEKELVKILREMLFFKKEKVLEPDKEGPERVKNAG